MTTRDVKHAVKLQEWGQMVKLCQESGLPINEWCEQNSIKPSSYYYRLSQVRKTATSIPAACGASATALPGKPAQQPLRGFRASFELCLQEKNSEEMRHAGTWMTIIASVLQDIRKMIGKTVDKGINPSIMKILG